MFFTRWKDLGPDPENGIWKKHIPPNASDLPSSFMNGFLAPTSVGAQAAVGIQTAMGTQTQAGHQSQDGEISSAFGDGNNFKFDSWLTPKNKSELLRLQSDA